MSRLIHLNGAPGIGKSTLARRYVGEHPGVLNCDVDVLRTLVGGWQVDFGAAGALIRPAALAMITAYLRGGHDVVLPQMLVDLAELGRFEAAAHSAGAGFVECMLVDEPGATVSRFHRRGAADGETEWHEQVRAIVQAGGGDELLARYADGLRTVVSHRPGVVVVRSVEGAVDQTYREFVRAVC